MQIDFDSLGTKIARRRRELGLKQNELSEMLGISNNYLSNIENGHSIPSLEVFSDICIKLRITPDMLLLGVIRIDNVPENIKDNLKLCTNKELKFIDTMVQCILNSRDSDGVNNEITYL
ncbi:MAG: helix-turn-helix transcriptional regulator [Clostridia bacterium]|nr:helix-turn-helix transcriptional regulator [Clostridia bacterium]